MKVKCRRCDICDIEIHGCDFQYWLKGPRIKYGRPSVDDSMKRMDLCQRCWDNLCMNIRLTIADVKEC